MSRKDATEKDNNQIKEKKTPAQREKEEKENRLAALSGIVQEKIRDKENLENAASQIEVPDLTGKQVVHRKFGSGEILSCEGRVFHASFANGKKIRMQFPDAFDKEILTPGGDEDAAVFESICEKFRAIDDQKDALSRRIFEISVEKSKINL